MPPATWPGSVIAVMGAGVVKVTPAAELARLPVDEQRAAVASGDPAEIRAEATRAKEKRKKSERPPFDAYWTPLGHAYAICLYLRDVLGLNPLTILENAVGGGAWVIAARLVWPLAAVDRMDIDPAAPGLSLDLRPGETAEVCDWMQRPPDGRRWDLVLGNPPYAGDLHGWVVRSLQVADDVSFLLRTSFLGSRKRQEWFLGAGAPWEACLVAPRPAWEGPGEQENSDMADSVQVTWSPPAGPPTRLSWLDVDQHPVPPEALQLVGRAA